MPTTIDTAKVAGRRDLHFNSLDDIIADVEHLATAKEVRSLGNWSSGQVLKHLTIVMNGCIDGTPKVMPGFVRFFISLFLKKRFLNQPMPPGFQLPAKAASLLPPPTTWQEGLDGFRKAAKRLKTETTRYPHPALGPLDVEQWNQVHCRHSELHLSFLVPA